MTFEEFTGIVADHRILAERLRETAACKVTVQIPRNIQEKIIRSTIGWRSGGQFFREAVRRKDVVSRMMTVEAWSKIWLEEYVKRNRNSKANDEHEGNIRLHINYE